MDAVMQLAQAASEQPPQGTREEEVTQASAEIHGQENQKKRRLSEIEADPTANHSGDAIGDAVSAQNGSEKVVASQSTGAEKKQKSDEPSSAAGEGSKAAWASNEQLTNLFNSELGLSAEAAAAAAVAAAKADEQAAEDVNAGAQQEQEELQEHAALTDSHQSLRHGHGDQSMADISGLDTSADVSTSVGADGTTLDAPRSAEEETARILAMNGRKLNTSKRAAQNRAAQRAFRARRDEYVRQVEEKAKHYDQLVTELEGYKERYELTVRLVEALRDDNQSLRSMIGTLGGRVPDPSKEVAELDKSRLAAEESSKLAATKPTEVEGAVAITDETTEKGKLGDSTDSHQDKLNELSAAAAAVASAAESTADEGAAAANEPIGTEESAKAA